MTTAATWLRGAAILIAVAALIDPAITSARRAQPEVAVIAADAGMAPLARRVADGLAGAFTVIPGPYHGAAATVIVGDRVPASVSGAGTPLFAVLPERTDPAVTVAAVSAPAQAVLHAAVPVDVEVRATGLRGRRIDVALEAGALLADRVVRDVMRDDERLSVRLTWVPAVPGAAPLRVRAGPEGGPVRARADVRVDVHETRRSVLFYDPRPSWMSTFVRRAVERDPRLTVTSRTFTSRDISTDAGRPPASLDDAGAVARFDAIVVGAPDALAERDVAGLENYLRRRAGAVLLLIDRQDAGPWERLVQPGEWSSARFAAAVDVSRATRDTSRLRASTLAWPARLPAGARPVAFSRPAADAGAQPQPVLWGSAIGAGRLIVSGALDAWRFRADSTPAFDRFWRTLVADLADATPPALEIDIANAWLAPDETTDVTVTLPGAALAEPAPGDTLLASISVRLESASDTTHVRLWPDARAGRFRGRLRAPATPDTYRLIASAGDASAHANIVVTPDVARTTPDERDLLVAWTAARGGSAHNASDADALRDALDRALRPGPRPVTWHPMRSAWWIVPFALLLGLEWWLRRRRGAR